MGLHANERVIQVDGPAFMALNAAELATEPIEEPIDAFGAAGTTLLRHEPLGVVSILTPWNFPHTPQRDESLRARWPPATPSCSSRRR